MKSRNNFFCKKNTLEDEILGHIAFINKKNQKSNLKSKFNSTSKKDKQLAYLKIVILNYYILNCLNSIFVECAFLFMF